VEAPSDHGWDDTGIVVPVLPVAFIRVVPTFYFEVVSTLKNVVFLAMTLFLSPLWRSTLSGSLEAGSWLYLACWMDRGLDRALASLPLLSRTEKNPAMCSRRPRAHTSFLESLEVSVEITLEKGTILPGLSNSEIKYFTLLRVFYFFHFARHLNERAF